MFLIKYQINFPQKNQKNKMKLKILKNYCKNDLIFELNILILYKL